MCLCAYRTQDDAGEGVPGSAVSAGPVEADMGGGGAVGAGGMDAVEGGDGAYHNDTDVDEVSSSNVPLHLTYANIHPW